MIPSLFCVCVDDLGRVDRRGELSGILQENAKRNGMKWRKGNTEY